MQSGLLPAGAVSTAPRPPGHTRGTGREQWRVTHGIRRTVALFAVLAAGPAAGLLSAPAAATTNAVNVEWSLALVLGSWFLYRYLRARVGVATSIAAVSAASVAVSCDSPPLAES